ncbi:hypothetical protein [Streptomyces mirabilis]
MTRKTSSRAVPLVEAMSSAMNVLLAPASANEASRVGVKMPMP